MKIKNTINKIEVGKVYHYDIKSLFTGLHVGTKTVRVLQIEKRYNKNPLAKVQSIETGEIFSTDISHLQVNPEILKKKFITTKYYYKKFNNKMVCKPLKRVYLKPEEYIIIGDKPEVNCLLCLNKNGIVHDISYYWFEDFDLKRNV
ncbi:MAG: hypothetical protein PHT02_01160 [Tissierellia bacterium]|nr:hypothetical protein [Tissierellia bacterium]